MSLLNTFRFNVRYPFTYLKDVLLRLPTQPALTLRCLLMFGWGQVLA